MVQKTVMVLLVRLVLVGSDLIAVAGCGKRTVVKYVSRRLGLHVVEYSCRSLMASERKASVALAQAFNTAQR